MSTTFSVLPNKITIPTYTEILELANLNTNAYLLSIGVEKKIDIRFNLHKITTNELLEYNSEEKLVHDENNYAWFFVSDVSGGTDCYYYKNIPIDIEAWQEELKSNVNAQRYKEEIVKNLEIGYRWIFRRSAGQPPIIALSYGMLAASLASITDGIIFSDDGAWDYSLFPTKPDDFFNWYFKPELSTDEDDRTFSMNCIKAIKKELQ